MKIRTKSIQEFREWIALAGGVVAMVLIYVVLVQPPFRLSRQYDAALESWRAAENELEATRKAFDELQAQLALDRSRLKELGGSPPLASGKDLVIARITGLAKVCEVTVDRYSPVDVVDEPDHRAIFVRFAGRGDFHAIKDYFRRFEKEIDFVDVTHFSLTAEPAGGAYSCQLSWSCRINGLRPEKGKAEGAE